MQVAKGATMIRLGVVALALAALSVAFVGCSTDAPLAPANADNELAGLNAISFVEDQFGSDPFSVVPDSGVNPENGLAKYVVRWLSSDADHAAVGPDGGEIFLCLDTDTSRLVIPEGALDNEVLIKARAVLFATPVGPVRFYEFLPEGLQFNVPATLFLSTNLEEGTELRLFWYNPETGKWQLEQEEEADENGVVEFDVFHFSKYAIS